MPVLEAEAAEAQSLFESRALVQLELDERATTVGAVSVATSTSAAAQLAERRQVLEHRLTEVDDRLARDPERRAEAERHRVALEERGLGYTAVGEPLSASSPSGSTRCSVAGAPPAGPRPSAPPPPATSSRSCARRAPRPSRSCSRCASCCSGATSTRPRPGSGWRPRSRSLRAEYDVEPAIALDAPAPEVPAGTTLAGRARDLDRELRLMGPINPLALEEHDALLERHEFLQAQLEDVKASRRELNRVIKAVDQEIVSVFAEAFADVQQNFTDLFTTLFPGGSGKIVLTDPDDLLNTGIEMEARPSGKNVRRLSLLSGGERSLTALAFLFAVFRARPSPFYLMDEVEAALDDVNLHRFLDLVHEFRDEAQLLVVSHQKRTMEAADCLYGVSMPPGGSSRVVSQRVNDDLPVA